MRRSNLVRMVSIAALLVAPTLAHAGIWIKAAKGLAVFNTEFDGERNFLGDGWDINTAAVFQNETYDFGNLDLTLNGVVTTEMGLTRRGIPTASFALNSNQLSYELDFNTGAQDFLATGSILLNIDTEINQYGFYDQTLNISNRGDFEIDGYLLQDSGTLNFDVGPIDVSGNVYLDVLALVSEPFFQATGTVNPFSKLTGRATKAAELKAGAEMLSARAAAGEQLTEAEIATLVNNTVLAAILGGKPSDDLFDDLFLPPELLDQMKSPAPMLAAQSPTPTPEPGSLALLGLGSFAVLLRRPRGA